MSSIKSAPSTRSKRCAVGLLLLGLSILTLNVAGMLKPLRAPEVTGYVDFAGTPTIPYEEAIGRLNAIADSPMPPDELATKATRVFHEGIAHIAPQDVETHGYDHYAMRVPPTENWVLYALSYVKPDTYRDYEFCNYRRVLRRGTGRCGQSALALVSFLSGQGLETGFVALGGHAIATAQVADDSWYLLDPDYGGVIPFGIGAAEQNPASVLSYYWSTAAESNGLHHAFAPERNKLKIGGPEARFGRACHIETISYLVKWVVPFAFLLFGAVILIRANRRS